MDTLERLREEREAILTELARRPSEELERKLAQIERQIRIEAEQVLYGS